MAQITKLELQQRLDAANKTIADMRLRISVLEGAAALRTAPAATQQHRISIGGVDHNVVIERHGARVIKRYFPA